MLKADRRFVLAALQRSGAGTGSSALDHVHPKFRNEPEFLAAALSMSSAGVAAARSRNAVREDGLTRGQREIVQSHAPSLQAKSQKSKTMR